MTTIRPLATLTLSLLLAAGSVLAQTPNSPPAPAAKDTKDKEVGISAHDGISMSGADVLVTRNGNTEKLSKEITLTNGLRVLPDGSLIRADGGKFSLRPTQILTFEGTLLDPAAPATVTTKTVTTKAPLNKEAKDAADAEAAKRAEAAANAQSSQSRP